VVRRLLIRAVFIARGVVSVLFAAWLGAESGSHLALISPFIWFATVDGILAICMGALALAVPALHGMFVLVAIVDGLVLLAAALTLRIAPGIPYYFVALVLYVGLAGIFALCIGLLKVIAARQIQRKVGGNALSGALGLAGLASIALGAGAFFLHPEPATGRWLLIAGALTEGFALLVAALLPWSRAVMAEIDQTQRIGV
jgi:hypothetical protein